MNRSFQREGERRGARRAAALEDVDQERAGSGIELKAQAGGRGLAQRFARPHQYGPGRTRFRGHTQAP